MSTAKPDLKLQPHFVFGVQTNVANGLVYLDEQSILFPSGNKCVRFNTEEKSQVFIPVPQRQGLRAMALSADRRYLAVCERGEPGGVTVYDLKENKTEYFLTVDDAKVEEFVAVAFSHDFRYLIGQSGAPGWILYCWNLREKRVTARQKTGSPRRPINQVSFSPGASAQICVTGKGVFTLFQFATEKPLQCRFMLKDMESLNFLAHLWVSESRVIVGTDSGRLMGFESGVLDWESGLDSESPEERGRWEQESVLQPSVMSIAAWSSGFICSAGRDRVCLFEMTDDGAFKKCREIQIPADPHLARKQEVVAMCVSPSGATLLASTNCGQLYCANLISSKEREEGDPVEFEYLLHYFHSDTITSLSICIHKPLIATSSKDHSVCIWNFRSRELVIRKSFSEEPRSVALNPLGLFVMVAFSERLLWMNLLMDDLSFFKEFKLKGCTECAFSNGGHMFAAVCGAVVHIYSTASCDPVMELADHKAAVCSARWSEDDGRLVTCDSDGVMYLWDTRRGELDSECSHEVARYTGATISPDAVSVFTIGKDWTLREIRNGQIIREVKTGVSVEAVALSHEGKVLFCGSSDGSVTVRSCPLRDSKQLLEYRGHAGAITRMEVTYDDQFLLTISDDRSLLIWKIDWGWSGPQRDEISYLEEILISESNLLQKNLDLKELKSGMERLKTEKQLEAQQKDTAHETALSQMKEEFAQRMEALEQRNNLLVVEKQNLELEHRKILKEEREEHERVIKDLNSTQAEEMEETIETFHLQYTRLKEELDDCKRQLKSTKDNSNCAMEQLRDSYESKLQKGKLLLQTTTEQSQKMKSKYELMIQRIKEDAETKILDAQLMNETKLNNDRESCEQYKDQVLLWSERFKLLQKDDLDKSVEIKRLTTEGQEREAQVTSLKEEIQALKEEKAESAEQMKKMEKQISAMRDAADQAEKQRFSQERRIQETTLQIKKQKQTIEELNEQARAMEKELKKVNEQSYQMKLDISNLERKLAACNEDKKQALMKASGLNTILARLKADLLSCVDCVQDPKKLKAAVLALHRRFMQQSDEDSLRPDQDQSKLRDGREKEDVVYGIVQSLQQRLAKEQLWHRSEQLKMLQETAVLIEKLNELKKELKKCKDEAHGYKQQLSSCSCAAEDPAPAPAPPLVGPGWRARTNPESPRLPPAQAGPASPAAAPLLARPALLHEHGPRSRKPKVSSLSNTKRS